MEFYPQCDCHVWTDEQECAGIFQRYCLACGAQALKNPGNYYAERIFAVRGEEWAIYGQFAKEYLDNIVAEKIRETA